MVVVPVLEPSPPPVAARATPTAELTVLTLVAEELPAETDAAADPAASPTWTGAAWTEVAASADIAKRPYRTFFITNSLHCMNGDLPKRISGEIEYTQPKYANYGTREFRIIRKKNVLMITFNMKTNINQLVKIII